MSGARFTINRIAALRATAVKSIDADTMRETVNGVKFAQDEQGQAMKEEFMQIATDLGFVRFCEVLLAGLTLADFVIACDELTGGYTKDLATPELQAVLQEMQAEQYRRARAMDVSVYLELVPRVSAERLSKFITDFDGMDISHEVTQKIVEYAREHHQHQDENITPALIEKIGRVQFCKVFVDSHEADERIVSPHELLDSTHDMPYPDDEDECKVLKELFDEYCKRENALFISIYRDFMHRLTPAYICDFIAAYAGTDLSMVVVDHIRETHRLAINPNNDNN